jgi:hypothetical protein
LEELAAASPGLRTNLDLVRGAINAWARSDGGNQMTQRFTYLAAASIVLPIFFLAMNVFNELSGSEGLLLESFFLSRFGTAMVALGPVAALALILLPSVTVGIDREGQSPALSLSLHLGRLQVFVLVTAMLTAIAFLGYAFVENYVPRPG